MREIIYMPAASIALQAHARLMQQVRKHAQADLPIEQGDRLPQLEAGCCVHILAHAQADGEPQIMIRDLRQRDGVLMLDQGGRHKSHTPAELANALLRAGLHNQKLTLALHVFGAGAGSQARYAHSLRLALDLLGLCAVEVAISALALHAALPLRKAA
ncbi:hypothetical protein V8J88_13845 [Massilia sp. W12]|uniref:hypothetical protein n=1 Tax=Massilia sp. W12 TaxID=3126507 RepID=UPI0030CCDF89